MRGKVSERFYLRLRALRGQSTHPLPPQHARTVAAPKRQPLSALVAPCRVRGGHPRGHCPQKGDPKRGDLINKQSNNNVQVTCFSDPPLSDPPPGTVKRSRTSAEVRSGPPRARPCPRPGRLRGLSDSAWAVGGSGRPAPLGCLSRGTARASDSGVTGL